MNRFKPKKQDICSDEEFTIAFESIQNLKQKTKSSKINMESYLHQLDSVYNDSKTEKKDLILQEKKRILESKKEVDDDLDNLENIEQTLRKVCPKSNSKLTRKK